jgi:hypothetical protein
MNELTNETFKNYAFDYILLKRLVISFESQINHNFKIFS